MKTTISILFLAVAFTLNIPTVCKAQTHHTNAVPSNSDTSIRPFHINIPQSQLDELKRRISETRFPDKETVKDASQGIQLAQLKDLITYCGNGYDWRKVENRCYGVVVQIV